MLYIGGSSRVLSLYGGGYLYTVHSRRSQCAYSVQWRLTVCCEKKNSSMLYRGGQQ